METVDVVVVGAGVIGLAVARALCLSGRSVIVVERHSRAGTETSSRNSGVIHSGIYYEPGSAKARLCVRGRELLYDYCQKRHVEHRQCGKLIVAQLSQIERLDKLRRTAILNGVHDLAWLDEQGIRQLEPLVHGAAGLWCPRAGIVSAYDLINALHSDIENADGVVAFRAELQSATSTAGGFELRLKVDDDDLNLHCAALVNSAGLAAVSLLSRIEGYPVTRMPGQFFAKGNYYEYAGRSPFCHLVYPMPSEAGLGVHATLDLGGQLRFGPDVEWLPPPLGEFDYTVDPRRSATFYAAIREYWPGLPDGSLRPSYSGIRPKLVGDGEPAADFRIEDSAEHGVPGLINLLGMESPGLTSSLAIGESFVRLFE